MKPKPIYERLRAFLLCFALLAGMLPVTAFAATNVQYIDADGTTNTCANATDVTSSTTSWSTGWYVVNSEVTISTRITVNGVVNLILGDNATLNANAGITVAQSNSLTIYAQENGTGKLIATAQSSSGNTGSNAGIGGTGSGGIGGAVTIYGGTVTATGGTAEYGGSGAGIGGAGGEGGEGGIGAIGSNGGAGGTVTIYGGTVTATGGAGQAGGGAGIGGGGGGGGVNSDNGDPQCATGGAGGAGGSVTIYGGTVTATSKTIRHSGSGAGIGGGGGSSGKTAGGKGGDCAPVAITGGLVTAKSGDTGIGGSGAGIGGGGGGSNFDLSAIADSGNPGTFSTQGGNAVIFASSGNGFHSGAAIGASETAVWSGVIFQGKAGTVYGDQTIEEDFTLEQGYTLTVPQNTTLTIPKGVTLTNRGTINGPGKLTGSGTVTNSGSISVSVNDFAVSVALSITSGGSTVTSVTYGSTVTLTATVTKNSGNVTDGTVTFYRGTADNGTSLGSVNVSNGTATLNNVQINSTNGFTTGSNTITAVYSGGTGLLASSNTTTLTVSAAQLAAPTNPSLTSNSEGTATANWGAVANASGYSVQLYNGDNAIGSAITVSNGTSHTFDISAAGSYTFTVTATGSGGYTDSSAATSSALTFYTVTFVNGQDTVDTQYVASGNTATLPSTSPAPPNDTQYFAGWVSDDSAFTESTIITGNTTVNASFENKRTQTATMPTWVSSDTDSITINTVSGQRYIYTTSSTPPAITDSGWTEAAESDGTYTFSSLSAPGATYYIWTYRPGGEQTLDSPVSAALTAYTAPEITTDSLTAATVDESYSATLAAAAADGSTVTWSATGLPDGLTISSDGIISGTPTTATGDSGTTVTITATISGTQVRNSKELTLVVNAGEMDGTVTISGDAIFDETLTANYTGNANSVSYQWYRDSAEISGATGSTYTLVEADIGQTISVTATSADSNYTGSVSDSTDTTVAKATGVIEISCSDVVYGNNVTVTVKQNTNTGADVVYSYSGAGSTSYGPSENAPTEVGTYSVTATVAETSAHTSASDTVTFSITQSGSSLNVQPSSANLTYGETLEITVTPSRTGQPPVTNSLSAYNTALDTVELIYDGDVLATATEADGSGTYTLRYDTTLKEIPVGNSLSLTVSYGGSDNLAASTATVTVSLSAKAVTASVSGTLEKPYDTGTGITVALAVNDTATGDSFTGTVSGDFADASVGESKAITLGNDPVWTNTATAGFYNISLPTGVTGTITRATPTLTLTAEPTALTGGGSVALTLTGLPEGESASVTCDNGITVTVGSDNTWTATLPNATQTYTFTASYGGSDNYNSATAVCTVEVTRRSSGGGGSSSRPTQPTGPSTDGSRGWSSIQDEISGARDGDTIVIDMDGETEVPGEIFEAVAGKDVDVIFQMDDDISWTVNGQDVPENTNIRDLDLGVDMGTSGIPVSVINAITGEVGTVQITLAHDGEFGFTMTLTAPLGRENRGLWANLYHYDEGAQKLVFETSAIIGNNGDVSLRFSHASQFAIIIDEASHDPEAAEPEALPFTDVARGAWYYDAVEYVYRSGLMAGTSGTTFSPDSTTTRGQIVTILWRMAGSPVVNFLMDFDDVDPAAYYGEAIRWATAEGVAGGYGDGSFGPNDPITREQMAVMLYRYAQYMGYDVTARADLSRFTDLGEDNWAREALAWAFSEGLLTGTSGSTMEPSGQASRAQIAVIMMRFCQRYVED